MPSRDSRAVDGLVAVSVLAFLAALAWHLRQPGYTHVRLAFLAVLGALAVAGGIGVRSERPLLAVAGAAGLVALGFWQAVLWVYVYPVAAVLLVGVVATEHRGGRGDALV